MQWEQQSEEVTGHTDRHRQTSTRQSQEASYSGQGPCASSAAWLGHRDRNEESPASSHEADLETITRAMFLGKWGPDRPGTRPPL